LDIEKRNLKFLSEERGWLLKILMQKDLPTDRRLFGEIYLSASINRRVKGNHYHERTTEWFCPIGGCGRVYLLDLHTKERCEILLDSLSPVCLQVPPGKAHAIVGLTDDPFVVLAYADLQYDPSDPDTIQYLVLEDNESK
jgi:dTDP-4-dehydrorhamnose 3,5-epimerase-like enzyme